MNRQKILTIVLFLIILLPNIYVLFGNEEIQGLYFKQFGYLIVSLTCVGIPALFLKKKIYFIVEGILSLLIAPIEISSIYLNKTTTNFMLMDSILNTNLSEAVELLSSIWPFVLFNIMIWIFYFYVTFRFIDNTTFFSQRTNKLFLYALPVLLLCGCIYFFTLARKIMTSESTSFKDNLIDMTDMMRFKFKKIFPFDVYIATGDVVQHHKKIKEQQQKLASFHFGLQPQNDSLNTEFNDSSETIVLIIGETARWKNFGINGYERNTTPHLSQQKNLISYSHFATMANLTSNSLPLIITRADATHSDITNQEKSISEAFSEAGFFTSWITDQEASTYLGRVIETCDFQYVIKHSQAMTGVYDVDMIAPFDSVLQMDHKKNFVVIHSLGSHFKYNQRYPSEFEKFTPCFNANMDLMSVTSDNAEMLRNAYDNSILYTDHFLHSVILSLEKKGGSWCMIYLSDHGENIFDDEKNLIMHGTLVVTPYEAHIPFFVAYSDEYAQRHTDKINNILTNKDKNMTSEVVFHSLLDMADLQSPIINDSLCIGRTTLSSKDSTYIMNGNRELVPFSFSTIK